MSLRFRQVHLDFHTSPLIRNIGADFDPSAFAAAFREAHVDSVTLFSKCHHGNSYHPTAVGRQHPHLTFDLLRAQIDALHAADIRTPVYLSAAWDEYAASEHPEWRIVSPDGTLTRFNVGPEGAGWAMLDFASPYLDYLAAQVTEVLNRYPDADGIFIDISFQLPSVSEAAKRSMEQAGLDWMSETDREAFKASSTQTFLTRIRDTVRSANPAMPLFFNSGHIRRGLRDHYDRFFSHLEIESLPTAGWGYDHFPLSARYIDPLGIPFLGMTGKFHTRWGEIGGYKKPGALIYECGAMLAQGARCSIGDHLHPSGSIDGSTMRIIAPAYEWVAQREAWVADTENVAEIALLSAESMVPAAKNLDPRDETQAADEGAVRVLLEGGYLFDVVDRDSDFGQYRLLILPDVIEVDDALRRRIEDYVAGGGRVLLTGQSGLGQGRFVFDVGADWLSASPNTGGEYFLPLDEHRAVLVDNPLFMYRPAERIALTHGQSLGDVIEPYFNRDPHHFSGHVHAPFDPQAPRHPAGTSAGAFTYLGFPIFSAYREVGAAAMLEIAEKIVLAALGTEEKTISTSLPRAGRVTLRRQASTNSDIMHLLHATPALRGVTRGATPVQPIQDLIELHDVRISFESRGEIASVRVIPEGSELAFEQTTRRASFIVPHMVGHAMVKIAYR